MKARVIATGKIVEVEWRYLTNLNGFNSIRYVDQKTGISYFEGDLDFDIEGKFAENCLKGIKQGNDYTPNYWTRLEHQYAGMAMQAMLTSPELMQVVTSAKELLTNEYAKRVAVVANRYAHALVEKYKEKEK